MLEFFDSDTLLQSAAHELIVMIIKNELVLKNFNKRKIDRNILGSFEQKNILIEVLSIWT